MFIFPIGKEKNREELWLWEIKDNTAFTLHMPYSVCQCALESAREFTKISRSHPQG